MAIFTTAEADNQQLDWTILRDGGVYLYWRQEILADDLKWLKSNGYRVVTFEAAEWESEHRMHESLKVQLSFPEYYGNNLNALDECMLDDLVVPDSGGLAIVLNHYDRFSKPLNHVDSDERITEEVLLRVFAKAVRHHMLFGRRLLILVQSEDPKIEFGRLGAVAACWNQREWLNKNRGL